jgi:sterol desaturase/sphingolipid hydroxylase (fatty acid hydroxylase superfamily)
MLWVALGLSRTLVVPLWSWLQPLGMAGFAVQMAVLIAVSDFLAYCRHRAEHAWFWRVHVTHHSPNELHAANDIGHPLQAVFSFIFIALPMSFIQIDGPSTPFVISSIVVLLSLYIHSPIDVHFGPLRRIIVDNRFHRIHHSLEPRHFHKNFGICLSVWDYLFGTAYDPGHEWPAVGVQGVAPPRTLRDFLLMPLLRSGSEQSSAHGPEAHHPEARPHRLRATLGQYRPPPI